MKKLTKKQKAANTAAITKSQAKALTKKAPVTPQVPAIEGTAPIGVKPPTKTADQSPIDKAIAAGRAGAKAITIGDGPFRATKIAADAGIGALHLKSGSSRYVLMTAMLKAKKPMSREDIEKIVPGQSANALSHGLRYGLIEVA